MPSPLLLARPSWPYVRFLIPADLRHLVGSRFIVRPLGVPHGGADQNRLIYDHVDMAPDWFDQSFLNQSDGSYTGRIGYGRVYARSATAPVRGALCLNTKFEFMNN